MKARYCHWEEQDLILNVFVQPSSSKDEVVGIYGEYLKIKITTLPLEGKANLHLIKLLAKQFGVAKSQVILIKGEKSRKKIFRVKSPKRHLMLQEKK